MNLLKEAEYMTQRLLDAVYTEIQTQKQNGRAISQQAAFRKAKKTLLSIDPDGLMTEKEWKNFKLAVALLTAPRQDHTLDRFVKIRSRLTVQQASRKTISTGGLVLEKT